MTKVLVLFGGNSPERPISIRSADAVSDALRKAGFEVIEFDAAKSKDDLIAAYNGIDVVFPVLHGQGGEDGSIQKTLEELNIPFVGSGSEASKICFDKWRFKTLLKSSNLPQPKGALVNVNNFENHPLAKKPFVLKPKDGGSSIDTYIVRDVTQNEINKCKESFTRHEEMLIESLITGTEITVGVLEETALPVIEIIPPSGKEFDLENKYNGATQELCPPKNISQKAQIAAQNLALKVHKLAGCRQMSRTDIIVDQNGNLFVLELNTIPGMTNQSLFPKSANQAGIDMPQLVTRLVNSVLA